MSGNLIKANSLVKEYQVKNTEEGNFLKRIFKGVKKRSVRALNAVSFSISEGEFVGLIGNNGAGKSTLVKLMTGILYPTSGTLQVLGRDPFRQRNKNSQELGVVFGQRSQLKWDLSAMDSFGLLKAIYQIDSVRYKQNLDRFTELFDMKEFIRQPVRTLSLGQRMRCEIAAAFLHNPRIVFLDEPTIGLDIFSKDAIAQFLSVMHREEKVTVILTTHDLEEMRRICDRAIVLDHGEILLEQKIDELLRNYNQKKKIIFSVKSEKTCFSMESDFKLVRKPYYLEVDDVSDNKISAVISTVISENDVADISIEEASFTDVIKSLLNEGGRMVC